MSVESIIGIVSSLITIGLFVPVVCKALKKQPVLELMKHLVNKELSTEQHRKILKKMNRKLVGCHIKEDYIQGFVLNNRGKEAVFMDICEKNGIEPTKEICVKFLGSDMPKFRANYKSEKDSSTTKSGQETTGKTVYMSELLKSRYPETCKNLTDILEKHNIKYAFLKGTKDIWCRDYMPVITESGNLIQFQI